MAGHRAEPPRRVRPRVGRMVAAGSSVLVTMIAVLGGIGVLPGSGAQSASAQGTTKPRVPAPAVAAPAPTTSPSTPVLPVPSPRTAAPVAPAVPAVPAASGRGRRAVFSISAQRVWLVAADGHTITSYLASGSLSDNLHPGRYRVTDRQRWALGIDDTGRMQYFVVFTHGQRAAIGFHSIPVKNGRPLQTLAQLGTPQSHGCIREKLSDARTMWRFAPLGTRVVVVA